MKTFLKILLALFLIGVALAVIGFFLGPVDKSLPEDTSAATSMSVTTAVQETEQAATKPSDSETTTAETTEVIITTESKELEVPEVGPDSSFEIWYLDVGQGDAACVVCDGHAMLIDGGNKGKSDLMYSFLRSHSISTLDCVVASHPDADHIGGLAGALNYATTTTAYCTTTEHNTETFGNFKKYLDVPITIPEPGDAFLLGSAKITFLYPEAGRTASDNTSIALRIEYGTTSFLFAGDCELDGHFSICIV